MSRTKNLDTTGLMVRSYLGKSTGAGSLGVWTHNLKDLRFMPGFELDGYKGPAFKVGAGVTATEMYHAAELHNLTILGSIAPVSAQPRKHS